MFSQHDPDVLYACSQHLHRSTDLGASWQVLSPDLTRNDPDKLKTSGGPITRDNTGAEIYCDIFALAESPHDANVLWAGSDDGLVHISRDGGDTWRDITPPDLPEWALISIIDLSAHQAGAAYLAATRYKLDDTRPYLYKTTDYGESWTQITMAFPKTNSRVSFARIPDGAACFMPARRPASTSHSMTALTGRARAATCPSAPSMT